jgi:hypothetical protein
MDSKKSSMTQERIDYLNELGFAWTVHASKSAVDCDVDKPTNSETKWFENLEFLKKYKQLNGDCMVPRAYPPHPGLFSWVRLFQERARTN